MKIERLDPNNPTAGDPAVPTVRRQPPVQASADRQAAMSGELDRAVKRVLTLERENELMREKLRLLKVWVDELDVTVGEEEGAYVGQLLNPKAALPRPVVVVKGDAAQ